MGIKIKNLQTGEFEKFDIPALKGEKGEPGEIESSEKVDYIGKQHSKLRDTMNANVDYIIKTAIGEFNYLDYEGQHITATNSIEGHAKSAILSGSTKYQIGEFIQDVCVPVQKFKTGYYLNWETGVLTSGEDNHKYCEDYIPLPTGVTSITSKGSSNWKKLCCYDSNKNFISGANGAVGLEDLTLNIPSNAKYFRYSTNTSQGKNEYINVVSNTGLLLASSNYNIPCELISCKMPVLQTVGKNLFDVHKVVEESTNKVSVTKNNETITITSISERGACYRDLDNMPIHLKANVRYTLSSNYAIAGDGQPYMRFYEVLDGGTRKPISATHKDDGSKIIKECTLTKDTIAYVGLYTATGTDGKLGSSVSYYNIQLEESEATSYEPYKSNILSCQPTPLSQSMFEQGSFSESTPYNTQPYENVKLNSGQHYGTRIRVKDTCKVVGGETYGVQLNEGYGIFICYCKNGLYSNTENKWIDMTNFTFTVPKDCDEMFFALRKTDNTQINTSEYPLIGLKIHQDITLRAIGDVKDTLNLMTGEYIQRIGEVVLDGSEAWEFDNNSNLSNTNRFYTKKVIVDDAKFSPSNTLNDAGLIDLPTGTSSNDNEHICIVNGKVYIRKNKTECLDLSTFKNWLSSNPITVQYELVTKSVKTVDLSGDVVYSYNEVTHYDCSSEEGSLVPTLSVDVPTDTQLTIQEQKATTQTLLIKNMDLQQSIKEVQAMNLAFNTALYNSFNSIREEVEDIKKHVSTNENLEGSF